MWQMTKMLLNWHKVDWATIRAGLSMVDWKEKLENLSSGKTWEKFTSVLEGLVKCT